MTQAATRSPSTRMGVMAALTLPLAGCVGGYEITERSALSRGNFAPDMTHEISFSPMTYDREANNARLVRAAARHCGLPVTDGQVNMPVQYVGGGGPLRWSLYFTCPSAN